MSLAVEVQLDFAVRARRLARELDQLSRDVERAGARSRHYLCSGNLRAFAEDARLGRIWHGGWGGAGLSVRQVLDAASAELHRRGYR